MGDVTHARGRPGVLLDRDGVLVEEVAYPSSEAELTLVPGVARAISDVKARGLPCVCCTNQALVAHGRITFERLQELHEHLRALIAREGGGAQLDRILVCPHHPEGKVEQYRKVCACRKPEPGLLLQALDALGLEAGVSIFIGDRTTDILAAQRAGVMPVGVLTGKHCQDAQHPLPPEVPLFPDAAMAMDWFLKMPQSVAPVISSSARAILVGGASRAGKTTLAASITLALRNRGQNAVHLSMDRWILPLSQRRETHTFLQRTQFDAAAHALGELRAGAKVSLPSYDPFTRECGPPVDLQVPSSAVMVVDGLMALALPMDHAQRLAVLEDDPALQARRTSFYAWKGLGTDAASRVLSARGDEEERVRQSLKHADHRVRIGADWRVDALPHS